MYGIHRDLSLIKPLLMSHITAVLSTDPDTMKFPSRVQQMSYTSSMCPLKTNQMVRNLLKPLLLQINIHQTANCKMDIICLMGIFSVRHWEKSDRSVIVSVGNYNFEIPSRVWSLHLHYWLANTVHLSNETYLYKGITWARFTCFDRGGHCANTVVMSKWIMRLRFLCSATVSQNTVQEFAMLPWKYIQVLWKTPWLKGTEAGRVVYLSVLTTDQLSLLSWASSSSWNMGACSGSLESLSFHRRIAASVPYRNQTITKGHYMLKYLFRITSSPLPCVTVLCLTYHLLLRQAALH